ncbi:Polyprotein [Phytophthora palmivora]|uniref:Polyprotein n=1 Tax=Phytophthora palmivora TaxID=4796 RepID=A0A2P4XTJ4_9STRA|nr:Polyprotein [Phytophthora palmivora]
MQPRLLPTLDNARSKNEFLQLTDGSNSVDNLPSLDDRDTSGHDSSDGEPDSKLPKLDDYEMAMTAMDVPRSYTEAMSSPELAKWKEGVRREIRSHIQNHTWDLIKRPRGIKVIGKNGYSRLNMTKMEMSHGYLQTNGIDYSHTYSFVASMNMIRVFLAVCCQRRLLLQQFDIETILLNEDVYMEPPQGIRVPDGMVCKLRRSLYGLKQAGAVWFRTIRTVFMKVGFSQCRVDPCLFVHCGEVDLKDLALEYPERSDLDVIESDVM